MMDAKKKAVFDMFFIVADTTEKRKNRPIVNMYTKEIVQDSIVCVT